MKLKLKTMALAVSACTALGLAAPAAAQISGDVIKIGFLTDLSGVYSDIDGPGGVEAIRLAIADVGGTVNGKKIEFLFADHLNKADVAASKAREWFDQHGVDMLIGGTNSGAVMAMSKVATEKKKPFLVVGGGSARLTNEDCSPYNVHYAWDTVAQAKGTGSAVVKQGGKNWFFLTADYVFGTSLENATSAVVKAAGGNVVGSVRHPLSASDYSSFMMQAQASKAHIIGLANAGGDTVNSIKAANEFGLTKNMKLAGLIMLINDVHALGLAQTQGMYQTDSWYWDKDEDARKWSRRYFDKMKRMPSSLQAADYSVALQYLNAVKATGTDNPDKVLAHMKSMKINDMYAKDGYIRPDGRMVHEMYLLQVKAPAESKYPWDYYEVAEKIPGEQAFTTKAESKCGLWK